MSDIAVRAEGVGKQYQIGQARRADTLRDAITTAVRGRLGRRRTQEEERRILWALKDVSFEVRQGEVLGVVGKNGAGKSTLLKILARVTEPTEGRVTVVGRLGSLLEVGTGFHPELTGRENVYLNGVILGMKRRDVQRKFDEIVAFSGVERFIDTPVKRYSSGMYARLAFAVASSVEPDVLLVDEVLSVGDAEFQKRCVERMQALSGSGKTVLFISHSTPAVRSLCTRAILLAAGRVTATGPVDDVLDSYLTAGSRHYETGIIPDDAVRVGTGTAKVRRVELFSLQDAPVSQLHLGQPFRVSVTVDVSQSFPDGVFEIDISAHDGTYGVTWFSVDGRKRPMAVAAGLQRISVEFDVFLLPGSYTLDVALHHAGAPYTIDFVRRALDFEVLRVAEYEAEQYPFEIRRGFVRPVARWSGPDEVEATVLNRMPEHAGRGE